MSIPGLSVDLDSATPVYRQIADGILSAVREGRLDWGRRLPPTRDLARQLGVNRNTVVAAYDLLASDGFVESRTGRGTFLMRQEGGTAAGGHAAEGGEGGDWFGGFSRAVEGSGVGRLRSIYRVAIASEGISFAGTYPAEELMPVDAFRRATQEVLTERGPDVLAYGPTAGYPALRETIAAGMRAEGSPVVSDNVLVTNGAQQAIDLVFRTLLDRGDAAVIEEPTYTGALSSLYSIGARIVGVPVDEEGIRPDLLALALERHRPRLLYVQPTFHNPTTAVMGEARRREVLALAARHRCVVVEDDWAGDLHFERVPPPTLHSLDGGRRVVYLSTFSKKLLPGLRVGWLAAPPAVLQRVVALKQIQDFGTSPLIQAALHRFLAGGGLPQHLERVRPAYRERRDVMLQSLETWLPEGSSWTRPEGGLFAWITLPPGAHSNELFVSARRAGVLFSRGELFHSEGAGETTLRLTYGAVSPERIRTGIEILGRLIAERTRDDVPGGSESTAEAVPIL